MDRIDQLIDCLNAGLAGGAVFDRDAVDVDRPDNWGAVELRAESETQWADDSPIDTISTCDVYLCVDDRESHWGADVVLALEAFDELAPCYWQQTGREYVPELDRILWKWQVRILVPLEIPDGEIQDGETDAGNGDAGADPDADPDADGAAGGGA